MPQLSQPQLGQKVCLACSQGHAIRVPPLSSAGRGLALRGWSAALAVAEVHPPAEGPGCKAPAGSPCVPQRQGAPSQGAGTSWGCCGPTRPFCERCPLCGSSGASSPFSTQESGFASSASLGAGGRGGAGACPAQQSRLPLPLFCVGLPSLVWREVFISLQLLVAPGGA